MKKNLILAVFLGVVLLTAGCSSGSSDDDIQDNANGHVETNSGNQKNNSGGQEETPVLYPNDDALRINQIMCRGTHNSYHKVGPLGGLPFLQSDLKPLDEQLEMGIRQFELDIHYNFGRGLKVYHAPVVDPYTTCEYLSECLTLIKDWSDKNFNHHVIFIFFEPKDDFDLKTDKLTGGRWAEIEQEILDIFPRERIFTPDDLTKGGSFATLRDAYAANGWPTLGETRGKVMFILFDSGPVRNEYVEGNPTLKGRVMFARGGADTPYGLFRNIDDPTDEENFKAIQDAVLNGFLIRTRADAECIEAYKKDFTRQQKALECGAQMISTDFPEPPEWSEYFFDIKTGTPSVCNPVTAPGGCSPKDIENLGNK